jgi:hypothetical protein
MPLPHTQQTHRGGRTYSAEDLEGWAKATGSPTPQLVVQGEWVAERTGEACMYVFEYGKHVWVQGREGAGEAPMHVERPT